MESGMLDEIWHKIDFADGRYMVSNHGRVMSTRLKKPLKQNNIGFGYMQVTLSFNKIRKSFLVHRLVAMSFKPNPKNLSQINHIDKNTSNNNYWNLEWSTPSQNVTHSYMLGRRVPSIVGRKYKVLDSLQKEVIKSSASEMSISALSKYFNVNRSTIRNVLK